MKINSLIAGFISIVFLASCGGASSEKFELSGEVENVGDVKMVYLYEGESPIDSTEFDANNKFIFERKAEGSNLYTLVVGYQPYLLILENGDKVEFKANLQESEAQYTVKGSEASAKLQELAVIRTQYQSAQSELQNEFEQRVEDGEPESTVQSELMAKSFESTKSVAEEAFKFANENRKNLAGFYGYLFVYSIDPTGYEKEIVEYSEEAQTTFANNQYVQSFVDHIIKLKPLSIGQKAPDFESLTPDGKKVKLSDFEGQYVLLDFWAAWCGPCRVENPNIVEQYHAYKDKGFTVLGVSLDKTQDAWVKAIEKDKLEWTQVSDLKEWSSDAAKLYNITSIPASFLISPDGEIIGKNLRGPALKEFLEKTL